MIKKLLGLGFAAALFAGQAQAGFIWNVTGSDMAGIEVTATFADTSSETLTWGSLGGASGGVTGTGWTLTVDGDTIVQNDPLDPMAGVWVLDIFGQMPITSLFIDLGTAFVFDIEFGDASANGSGDGREFSSDQPVSYAFSSQVGTELFTGLTLFDITGSNMFAVDTDAVPAPATLSLLGLAFLGGLVANNRRKKA